MNLLKLFILFILSTLLFVSTLVGKAEFTKKEGKPCNYCHTQGKELNEVGKCYEKTKSLADCKTPEPKPIKEPKSERRDDDASR